jgi:hypothetical protein
MNSLDRSLFQISDHTFWDAIHNRHSSRGGVYRVIAVENGKRISINRFLDTDHDGVLYIGKAVSFLDRVIALKKSVLPDYRGSSHICGRRYKANPNIAKKFPVENLFVELIETENPAGVEKKMISEYADRFGEVPPLNAI